MKLNYDLYKEQSVYFKAKVKQMIRAFIKSCPREVLIDILKSEKIIKQDWLAKGNKYMERKK